MKKLMMALAVATMPGAASAFTIYDEAVSGDFPLFTPEDLGTVSGGLILGSLDAGSTFTADGPDERDSFSFTLTETLDFSISIENETATSPGYVMFQGSSSSIGLFTDADVPSSLSAGFYDFGFVPNTNEGSFDYTIQLGSDFAAIPVPAGAALYLPLLIGAGVWAARRRPRAGRGD